MRKFICPVCGYLYDPAAGDLGREIAAGTAFDDLPDDWSCPGCDIVKTAFMPYGD
ncbi:rubredoxin [bacterium]|nr:rubredoxin [bacterium]